MGVYDMVKNIKDVVNNVDPNQKQYTHEEYTKMQSQWYNDEVGNLNEQDGINCPICKNKGNISFVENGQEYLKSCKCMKARLSYQRILNCGISKETFEKYSFQNWKQETEWQKALLEFCKNFFIDYRDKKNHWFLISGVSGCGKTHLCTALFKELIKSFSLSGFYMLWNEEIPKLIALRKSSLADNQAKYDKRMNELKNCDILYIDDLFKLDNKYKEESLSICYEIINSRYINNKVVMISTEIERNQFENIDTAVWGRCFEKSDGGKFWITIRGSEKNYRLKGEN